MVGCKQSLNFIGNSHFDFEILFENSKVPMELAQSTRLFHCCPHTIHSNFVCIHFWCTGVSHWTWVYFNGKNNSGGHLR